MSRPDLVAAWRSARRVLAVRLDNLGDVLMTTPALAALRAALPAAHITLLTSPSGAAVAPHLPEVNEVLPFDAPWVAGAATGTRPPDGASAEERRWIERLATRGFDAAVIFTVCTQSALPAALMCRLAGIGLRLAHSRENPYRLLTHWVPDEDRVGDGMRHEVQRQLDLVASIGAHLPPSQTGLRFALRPQDRAALDQRLARAGVGGHEPIVVVHPGATAASRRWPAARFGHAAALLARECHCRIVVAGGPDDAAAVAQVAAALPSSATAVTALAGQLNLGELAALIARAKVLLCNNSAPAHLAAALGTPVVVVYALTNPQHTPWQAPAASQVGSQAASGARVLSHDVPCRHCLRSVCPQPHHGCVLGVSADEAAAAALQLMAAHTRAPHAVVMNEAAA